MKSLMNKSIKRGRRHAKIRARISGTEERPRFSVFKSNTAIFAQLIDDDRGVTLVSARGEDPKKLGADIAKSAISKKIDRVVFDRGGYIYTGKIKVLADSAREAGLKF